MNVHVSKDYDSFKFLEGNRKINKAHLNNIRKSVDKNGQLITIIIVNQRMEIIDGQHRFLIFKEKKLPIYYVIKQNYGLREVHIYNQNTKNWTMEQFMLSYADMGYKDYQMYRLYKDKYNFGHYESVSILSDKTSIDGDAINKFKDGDFKIVNWSKSQDIAEKIYGFAPYYEGFRRRSFVLAMLKIFKHVKEYDHKNMISKISFQSAKLKDQVRTEHYIPILESIYNYKTRGKYIRFELKNK